MKGILQIEIIPYIPSSLLEISLVGGQRLTAGDADETDPAEMIFYRDEGD